MSSNRKQRYCRPEWILPVLLLAGACNTERQPCLEPLSAKLNVRCYQHVDSNNTYVDTLLPNVNFVSLDIDSARYWYFGADEQSSFSIVLSPLSDTARWAIVPDSAVTPADTLTFVYDRKLIFLSNACGYSYTYTLRSVLATRKNIDSVFLNSAEVTTKAGTEHVKLYF
jgi:hypothetical protein